MTGRMELTQMQLYQVAEKVSPNDWVTLGVHLGFTYPEIEQWKEEHKGVSTMNMTNKEREQNIQFHILPSTIAVVDIFT